MDSQDSRKVSNLNSSAMWQAFGNIAYSISLWICLILLARSSTTEEVGNFAFAMAVTAPVFMFANLRLRLVFATDVRHEFTSLHYVILRVLMIMVALVIIVFISAHLVTDLAVRIIILVVAIAKAIEAVSDILYGYFQLQGFGQKVGKSMLLKGLLVVVTAGVTLKYWSSASSLSLALLAAWAVLLMSYDMPAAYKLGFGSKCTNASLTSYFYQAKLLLIKTLPLAFVALICSLITNTPRYFLDTTIGSGGLGIYAAIAYFGVGLTLVATGLGQASLPDLGKAWAARNVKSFRFHYSRLLRIAAIIGVGSITFILIFGKEILGVVYGSEYQEQSHVFVIIMIAASLNMIGLYQWYALTAMGMFRHQVILSALVLVTLIALCFLLIPKIGLAGAALAEVLGALFQISIGGWLVVSKLAEIRKAETIAAISES